MEEFYKGLNSNVSIEHYGMPKRSGRYPWGSGENPYHHGQSGPRSEMRRKKKIDKTARKDAKRYADAKMYYGEGAGTRRKLLKAELSNKMKDEHYKKAFDYYMQGADYEKSAHRAKRERRTRDTVKKVRTTTHKVESALGVTAIGVASVYYLSNREQINNAIRRYSGMAVNAYADQKRRKDVADFLRRNNIV